MTRQPWNLVADVGGTNARFGLQDYASGRLQAVEYYSVADHSAFTDALGHFLADIQQRGQWQPTPLAACIAVACPVDNEDIRFTNSPWQFTRERVAAELGGARVDLINDFAAVGYAITDLKPQDWQQIGGGHPVSSKPIAVLGPGTGLGVCTLVPVGAGYQIVEGEGGHVDFAPVDAREVAVLEQLTARFGRVSVERLLSGIGIVNIYQSLACQAGVPPRYTEPEQITSAAVQGGDSLCVETLAMFCRILGATAGNLALTLGAKGGVYIAGGIVPRVLSFMETSEFRHRFEAKGRFRDYLAKIPVRVVVKEHLGLAGAIKKLVTEEI